MIIKYKEVILKESEFYRFNNASGEVFRFQDGVELGITGGESLEDGCCLCGNDYSGGDACLQSNIKPEKNFHQCNACICEDCIKKIITLYKDDKLFFLNE